MLKERLIKINMNILDRIVKANKTEKEKLFEALKANPLCHPMNSDLREC
jgi:hypothetical protein